MRKSLEHYYRWQFVYWFCLTFQQLMILILVGRCLSDEYIIFKVMVCVIAYF